MRYILLVALFNVAACTYNTTLKDFDFGSQRPEHLKDKSVAIVIEEGRIQDGHTTNTDVYNFHFSEVTTGVTEALKKKLSMAPAKVEIVKSQNLDPKKYQWLIYPTVKARSVHDFWTMGCFIEYSLEIRNREGKVVANESGTGKRNFFSSSQFDEKCRLAMSEVFIKVSDRALNLIR